jgi:hypothetical protein
VCRCHWHPGAYPLATQRRKRNTASADRKQATTDERRGYEIVYLREGLIDESRSSFVWTAVQTNVRGGITTSVLREMILASRIARKRREQERRIVV